VRRLTVDILIELGYSILSANGPVQALSLLDKHPNIVLLMTDVVMPGMDGRKLAEEALRRRPDLKVLFTTGYTRNAIVHNGTLDDGVDVRRHRDVLDAYAGILRADRKALYLGWACSKNRLGFGRQARRLSGLLRGTSSGPPAWLSGIRQRRFGASIFWE